MAVEYKSRKQEILGNMRLRSMVAVRLLLEDVHSTSNPVTPLKDMGLRTSVSKTMEIPQEGIIQGSIEWRVPYAQYQERGMRYDGTHPIRHYTTPGTGKHFASRAIEKTLTKIPLYFGGKI